MNDLLKQYASEIGIDDISLVQLIDSHRTLRAANRKRHEEWLAELHQAREIGMKQAIAEVKEYGWFSRETLRSMTLAQLVDLLQE